MKRSLLDMTQKISRKVERTILSPYDLNDSVYSIWDATGWKFVDVIREIEIRSTQARVTVIINTQTVGNDDFIVSETTRGLTFKFIKSNFSYTLDSSDYIEILGDIEPYA